MLAYLVEDPNSSCIELLRLCCQYADAFSLTKNRWKDTDESNRIFDALSPYLTTTIQTCHWFCNYVPENNPLEVQLYRVNEQSMKIVCTEYDRLFSECTFLNKPEDVCFFADGKLLMGTVLHEKICFVYEENESFVSLLKQAGQWEYQIDKADEQIVIHRIGSE